MKKSLGAKTLLFPTPVMVVGTYDHAGKPNLMIAAWGGICCSHPPCISISLRKATYTYASIVERKAFTIGIACESKVAEVDFIGMTSGRDIDKFQQTGLTVVRSESVDAPYASEFPVVIECALIHTIELGLHTQFIGEIVDVKADAEVLQPDGLPDFMKLQTIVFDTAHPAYHRVGPLVAPAFSIGEQIRGSRPQT